MTKRKLERKGFILFTLIYKSSSSEAVRAGIHQVGQEARSRKQEAGADAEATEACCLLSCSMWLAHAALLCNSRSLAHSGSKHLGYGSHTNHWLRKRPTGLSTAGFCRSIFSVEIASSQKIRSCVQMTSTIDPLPTWHSNLSMLSLLLIL